MAITDPGRVIASPLATLRVDSDVGRQVRAVVAAVGEYDIAEWVVGLPLNMDGSEGPQAQVTRRFGERLVQVVGASVRYVDERLSSIAADATLMEGELTRKKKKARRDKVAAQVILQTYLDQGQVGLGLPGDDLADEVEP